MTKSTGMGAQLWVGGSDLGADTNSLSKIAGGPAPIVMTDITQSGIARKGGERDGGMDVVSYWDPAAGASHSVYSALPRSDVLVTYANGTTIGTWAASCQALQIGYDGNRQQDGAFLLNVNTMADGYGLTWGQLATAGRRVDSAATGAGSVSPLDQLTTTPGAFGLIMFAHLFAFTGTSVTIKLQDSPDNVTYTDVTGATTGALSAAGAVRIATGAINVNRYIKVVTTGTFSNADFAVSVYRHRTQTDY